MLFRSIKRHIAREIVRQSLDFVVFPVLEYVNTLRNLADLLTRLEEDALKAVHLFRSQQIFVAPLAYKAFLELPTTRTAARIKVNTSPIDRPLSIQKATSLVSRELSKAKGASPY